jgi:hypothetical protein
MDVYLRQFFVSFVYTRKHTYISMKILHSRLKLELPKQTGQDPIKLNSP